MVALLRVQYTDYTKKDLMPYKKALKNAYRKGGLILGLGFWYYVTIPSIKIYVEYASSLERVRMILVLGVAERVANKCWNATRVMAQQAVVTPKRSREEHATGVSLQLGGEWDLSKYVDG